MGLFKSWKEVARRLNDSETAEESTFHSKNLRSDYFDEINGKKSRVRKIPHESGYGIWVILEVFTR